MKNHASVAITLRKKLQRISLMTLSMAMILITLLIIMSSFVIGSYALIESSTSKAILLTENAAPALMFHDTDTAQTLLQSLSNSEEIRVAAIYNEEKLKFADYSTNKLLPPASLISLEETLIKDIRYFTFIQPIVSQNQVIGGLYLEVSLIPLYWQLLWQFIFTLLAALISLIAAYYFVQRLNKSVLNPLTSLSGVMEQISNKSDYFARAESSNIIELDALANGFNRMLDGIQERDTQLANNLDHLEEEVSKRTHDLELKTNEAYQLAEKAQGASKAKSEFLATMSHEIRTPMNGVLGMTELLLATELNSRQKRLADIAYRSAESLLGIINNILDFSKIESGKFQLIANDFDLRNLLEDTVEIMGPQAHNKDLELVLHLPVDLHDIVRGDSERLRQVLVNLLGNAIKFTHQGEVRLKVSRLNQSETDNHLDLLFEVTDTGPGIDSKQQVNIFESFTQADGSITRRHGGTGLGLSISKQLVDMMGGELQLTSTLGQGARFYFNLRLEKSEQLIFEKAEILALKGINILIVDDNATNREILSEQLGHWGVNCYCASSGAQALNHLLDTKKNNKSYHIALLDWHMPEMDGMALAKAIHEEPSLQSMPLVMLSSDSVTLESDQDSYYGINYFLNKPVIQQKLLNCLLELMGLINNSSQNLSKSTPKHAPKLAGRILLAEDNLVNQEVGMGVLRAIGCQVEVVNNGLEAVEAVTEKEYDLILMDCHMPELDGFQATIKLREYEENQGTQNHIPIIALTADVQKGIIEQCLGSGMDGYLSKPFNKKQMQDLLIKWLPFKEEELVKPTLAHVITNEPSEKILNSAALDNLRELTTATGESMLSKAITLFLHSAPKEIDALQHALGQQDSVALTKSAHSFKSACANLGAQTLANYAASLESIAKQGQTQGVEDLLNTMKSELPEILTALRHELDSVTLAVNTELKPATQINPAVQSKRILLVDDDTNFRIITSSILTASAFIVDEAENGLQALDKIKQHKPDLVLMDAIMDELDGFETCKILRADLDMAEVPIIMSTGLGDIDSINRAFDCGATDFIVKPLNYPVLIHRLWFILRTDENSSELRNSKLQLSAAQRIARLGYWTWDIQNNYFQISEQLADLCGISLKTFEPTLEGFIRLILPDDREMVKDMIMTAPYSKTIQHIEYRLQIVKDEAILIPQDEVIFVHQEMVKVIENNQAKITGTVQDISQRKATEKQIYKLAYFDHLTGIASRSYYQEHIQTIINTARRRDEQFAFLFLDLDGFKDINDSLGHNIGDQLLKVIAKRLQEVIRDIDFAARLGGDEFCIILTNINDDESVAEVAHRCLQQINAPLILNHQQIKPRVSIGIAIFPRDGEDDMELMKAADTAMYAAKEAGKQCYVFYSKDMAIKAITRLEKEQMLRDAFEKEQFILHFQPQISMRTGRMIGVEALTRWHHPEKGMIPPNDFIPLTEQLGLIIELGNWVIKTVCEQIAQWHSAGLPYLQVAVNISPLHFQDKMLLNTIQNILKETGVPAQYLELEVTESAMQTEGHLDIFNRLRKIGVKISIDDFGTGYSCLASLKQLPLDCIKIDKTFVDDVLTNSHTALLLGAIIGLAKALDYKLVAEGVESKDQVLVMYGLGCEIIQGYYFSRPIPHDEIPNLINMDYSHHIDNLEQV